MRDVVALPEIDSLLRTHGVSAWGVARNNPQLALAPSLPRALSLLVSFDSAAFVGMESGPSHAYHAEYRRLNATLNVAAAELAHHLEDAGHSAITIAATLGADEKVVDWGSAGVFAHKTAATQAGLGWIGKTALFVSPIFGPKVRLATVFTDLDLPPGTPLTAGRCAGCRRCVDACPAGAGRDVQWHAGMARDLLYDYRACRRQLDSFPEFGELCGVCVAVCPFGRPRRGSAPA